MIIKVLAVKEQITISGGIMVRIVRMVSFSVLESRCCGTSSFCGILSPRDITSSSRFFTTVGFFCS